ncbi:hypothetical protein D9M73_103600 [compost metagenome]
MGVIAGRIEIVAAEGRLYAELIFVRLGIGRRRRGAEGGAGGGRHLDMAGAAIGPEMAGEVVIEANRPVGHLRTEAELVGRAGQRHHRVGERAGQRRVRHRLGEILKAVIVVPFVPDTAVEP